jgi:hypothetical protein
MPGMPFIRNPRSVMEESTLELILGFIWVFAWTLATVAGPTWMLIAADFRGQAAPILAIVAVVFFVGGSGALWSIGRELFRRRKSRK